MSEPGIHRRGILPLVAVLAFAGALGSAPSSTRAGDDTGASPGTRAKGSIREGARTGGHAAKNGLLTFGRSTRAFFKGGTAAARQTWKDNAARTEADAKAGGRKTRAAARGE